MNDFCFYTDNVLRTPLLPFKNIIDYDDIKILLKQKNVREAIYLASASLYYEIRKWESGLLKTKKEEEKLFISLYKYMTRMSSRATPFGLFAGCSSIKWGKEGTVTFQKDISLIRRSQLSFELVCSIARKIYEIPEVKKNIQYYSNTSIQNYNQKIRFIEYFYNSRSRLYKLSEAEKHDLIGEILLLAKDGILYQELVEVITATYSELDNNEIESFVVELIDSKILLSVFEPNITGTEYFDRIIAIVDGLQHIPLVYNTKNQLTEIKQTLQKLDLGQNNDIVEYEDLLEKIKKIPKQYSTNNIFKVDVFKTCSNEAAISISTQELLSETIEFLNTIPLPHGTNINLHNFIMEFYNRYEEQEIPLLEALDPESGIGYPVKGTSNVLSPKGSDNDPKTSIKWDTFHQFIHKLMTLSIENKQSCIDLNAIDIAKYKKEKFNPENIYTIMYSVLSDSYQTEYLHIKSITNRPLTKLVGRFTGGSDQLKGTVEKIINLTADSNDIVEAEIIYLPNDSLGNVICHPRLYEYEIPFLLHSEAKENEKIALSDLMISIDIKRNEINIRSKLLNKIIRPRLSNAHNFTKHGMPVYRFLCELECRDDISFNFHWGHLTNIYKYFPRIAYKNVVLSRAAWRFDKDDLNKIFEGDLTTESINKWRKQYNLPDNILFLEGDHEMLINFNRELAVKTFISLIKKKKTVEICEFLYDNAKCEIKDDENNSYVNELISTYYNKNIIKKKSTYKPLLLGNEAKSVRRNYTPGTEWVYYKIYCGEKTADTVLLSIYPVIRELIGNRLIDKWFFIRYTDPDFHVRLRLHCTNGCEPYQVMKTINNCLNDLLLNKCIWNITLDTYKREIERYGSQFIEQCENLFYLDSECVMNLIHDVKDNTNVFFKTIFSISTISYYLENFGLNDDQIYSFLRHYNSNSNISKDTKVKMGHEFRKQRKYLEQVFAKGIKTDKYRKRGDLIYRQDAYLIDKIIDKNRSNMDMTYPQLNSLIHMSINRVFETNRRKNENIAYYYYERLKTSETARIKKISDLSFK